MSGTVTDGGDLTAGSRRPAATAPALRRGGRLAERLLPRNWNYPLVSAVLLILVTVTIVEWRMIWGGLTPVSPDAIDYYYPLTSLTGSMLRSGDLPAWNPYQMSGMPLMADPQAGWGNITTMLAYAFLSLQDATVVALTVQMALAALGMLLFLRSTGVGFAGATLGALSYGLGGKYFASQMWFAYVGRMAWLPWLLLGADMGLRCRGRRRILGWTLAGFAASQQLSIWAGQGAYYALVAAAAYVAFGALLGPLAEGRSLWARLRELGIQAVALGGFTLGLSGWTLFPRLEFLALSNLQSGYSAVQSQFVGGAPVDMLATYFQSGGAYAGATVILLTLAAGFLRPNRPQIFYAGMVILTYVVSLKWLVELAEGSPVVRSLLRLAPGVLQLHLHYPERIAFLYLFFAAALAGTTLDRLLDAPRRLRYSLPVAALGAVVALVALAGREALGLATYGLFYIGLALAAITVLAVWSRRLPARTGAVALVVLTAAELAYNATAGPVAFTEKESYKIRFGDVDRVYGAPHIRSSVAMLESTPSQGRFFGYPYGSQGIRKFVSRRSHDEPGEALLLTTQATIYRLEDLQGYNPVHLASYDRLLAVANGERQENYHDAYILPRALQSPLLDLLNARYTLTSNLTRLSGKYRLLDWAKGVRLYENTRAMPRSWVVHRVRQVQDDAMALRMIDSGEINVRRRAAVTEPVEAVRPSKGPERVVTEKYTPNEIRIRAELSSPGLVVLSELDYPAWKVRVDGRSQQSVRANGGLRAVRVPEGSHTITWYYSSTPTKIGFALSIATTIGILVALFRWPRFSRRNSLVRAEVPAPGSAASERG